MTEKVKIIHEQSRSTYGSPRIHAALNKAGDLCSLNRVARLMREEQLETTKHKKYVLTTDSKHSLPIAKNVLNRVFKAKKPNKVWLADNLYLDR